MDRKKAMNIPEKGEITMKENKKKCTEKIETDPLGSYTGRPADPKDAPVQDADDL